MRTGAVKVIGTLLFSALFVIGLSVAGYCGGNTEGGNQGGGSTQQYKETAPMIEGVLTLTQVPEGAPYAGPGPGPTGQAWYSLAGSCNNNKLVSVNTDPNTLPGFTMGYIQFVYPDPNPFDSIPADPKPLALVTEDDLVGYRTTVIPPGCGAKVVYPDGTEAQIILKTVKSFSKTCTPDNYCRIVANVIFFNLVPR